MTDPTLRFSNRVENYVKYRPTYPAALVDVLRRHGALHEGDRIADVGSGTGFLAELFLRAGHRVYGVEPNAPMRAAGEAYLAAWPRFVSLDGTAERLPLPDGAVEAVTAGQAFHWFDAAAARREFARVLVQHGRVVLVWNARRLQGDPFHEDYERLLREHGTDYVAVRHQGVDDAALGAFYGGSFTTETLPHHQDLDYAAFEGRLLSSSYAPDAGQPGHERMVDDLRAVFARHQRDGRVTLRYGTRIHFGRLQETARS